jgi:hypothetical protein
VYDSLGQLHIGATGEQPPKLDFAKGINHFVSTLRLPYRLKEDLHKLRGWRNACVHGIELPGPSGGRIGRRARRCSPIARTSRRSSRPSMKATADWPHASRRSDEPEVVMYSPGRKATRCVSFRYRL